MKHLVAAAVVILVGLGIAGKSIHLGSIYIMLPAVVINMVVFAFLKFKVSKSLNPPKMKTLMARMVASIVMSLIYSIIMANYRIAPGLKIEVAFKIEIFLLLSPILYSFVLISDGE